MLMLPQDLTSEHLGMMLHRLLIDLRMQAMCDELDSANTARLLDVAELIPLQLIHRDESYLRIIIDSVLDLADELPTARRMAAVLDMNHDEVIRYLLPNHNAELASV